MHPSALGKDDVKGFLFDLDQTLVDSSALLGHRRMGWWTTVMNTLHKVRAFPGSPAPHELPGKLAAAGYKIAVVTSSPRHYAEALLKQFGVSYDALVASGDTAEKKPDPAPLLKAVADLGLTAEAVWHVGDDPKDHEASYRAGIKSIGAGWAENAKASASPDVVAMTAAELLNPQFLPQASYVGEALAAASSPWPHAGWAIACDATTTALGRYFKTADPRHAHHPLTAAILDFKDHDTQAAMFGRAVAEFMKSSPWQPTFIVPVPPKPDQTRNRFALLLQQAAPLLPGVTMYPDGLKCVKQIDGYKGMSAAARRAAIQGAFVSNYTWNGAKVLLLDDVHTTSSTTAECARMLSVAKASEVRTLVLAKDQDSFAPLRTCDRCGANMKVRKGKNGPFWGCTKWRRPPDPTSCTFTVNIDP